MSPKVIHPVILLILCLTSLVISIPTRSDERDIIEDPEELENSVNNASNEINSEIIPKETTHSALHSATVALNNAKNAVNKVGAGAALIKAGNLLKMSADHSTGKNSVEVGEPINKISDEKPYISKVESEVPDVHNPQGILYLSGQSDNPVHGDTSIQKEDNDKGSDHSHEVGNVIEPVLHANPEKENEGVQSPGNPSVTGGILTPTGSIFVPNHSGTNNVDKVVNADGTIGIPGILYIGADGQIVANVGNVNVTVNDTKPTFGDRFGDSDETASGINFGIGNGGQGIYQTGAGGNFISNSISQRPGLFGQILGNRPHGSGILFRPGGININSIFSRPGYGGYYGGYTNGIYRPGNVGISYKPGSIIGLAGGQGGAGINYGYHVGTNGGYNRPGYNVGLNGANGGIGINYKPGSFVGVAGSNGGASINYQPGYNIGYQPGSLIGLAGGNGGVGVNYHDGYDVGVNGGNGGINSGYKPGSLIGLTGGNGGVGLNYHNGYQVGVNGGNGGINIGYKPGSLIGLAGGNGGVGLNYHNGYQVGVNGGSGGIGINYKTGGNAENAGRDSINIQNGFNIDKNGQNEGFGINFKPGSTTGTAEGNERDSINIHPGSNVVTNGENGGYDINFKPGSMIDVAGGNGGNRINIQPGSKIVSNGENGGIGINFNPGSMIGVAGGNGGNSINIQPGSNIVTNGENGGIGINFKPASITGVAGENGAVNFKGKGTQSYNPNGQTNANRDENLNIDITTGNNNDALYGKREQNINSINAVFDNGNKNNPKSDVSVNIGGDRQTLTPKDTGRINFLNEGRPYSDYDYDKNYIITQKENYVPNHEVNINLHNNGNYKPNSNDIGSNGYITHDRTNNGRYSYNPSDDREISNGAAIVEPSININTGRDDRRPGGYYNGINADGSSKISETEKGGLYIAGTNGKNSNQNNLYISSGGSVEVPSNGNRFGDSADVNANIPTTGIVVHPPKLVVVKCDHETDASGNPIHSYHLVNDVDSGSVGNRVASNADYEYGRRNQQGPIEVGNGKPTYQQGAYIGLAGEPETSRTRSEFVGIAGGNNGYGGQINNGNYGRYRSSRVGDHFVGAIHSAVGAIHKVNEAARGVVRGIFSSIGEFANGGAGRE